MGNEFAGVVEVVATMPEGRSFGAIAPATEGAHYARTHIRAAGVDEGSEILVHGARTALY